MEGFESFIGVNFWTALVTLINFLLVFFVAKHFLIGPVLKLIKDRQDEIDGDRKSTRLNSSHVALSRMPSSA